MASSDEFAPERTVQKLLRQLHTHFPTVVPAAPRVFRAGAAVVVTFADPHDGIVILRDLAEVVIGDADVTVPYAHIRCGACRIQGKCQPARAIRCDHLTPRERWHRVTREILRAIGRALQN